MRTERHLFDAVRERAQTSYQAVIRPRLIDAVDGYGWAEEHAFMRTWMRPVSGPLLDIACGRGEHGRALARWHGRRRVVALDLDPMALAVASRAKDAAHNSVVADVTALPIDDDACGGAICFGGFAVFADPQTTLAEIARVLRHDAPLVLLSPRKSGSRLGRTAQRATTMRFYDDATWRAMLAEAGFGRPHVQGRGWTTLIAAKRARRART